MKDQDFKRYTANINGEIQATNFLKVGMGMNASHSIKNYGIINNTSNSTYKDSYGYAVAKMPFAPAYDEDRQRMKLVIIVLCLILMEKLILVKSGRRLKG